MSINEKIQKADDKFIYNANNNLSNHRGKDVLALAVTAAAGKGSIYFFKEYYRKEYVIESMKEDVAKFLKTAKEVEQPYKDILSIGAQVQSKKIERISTSQKYDLGFGFTLGLLAAIGVVYLGNRIRQTIKFNKW